MPIFVRPGEAGDNKPPTTLKRIAQAIIVTGGTALAALLTLPFFFREEDE